MPDQPDPWRCAHCERPASECWRRGLSPVCVACYDELAAHGRKVCATCRQTLPFDAFVQYGDGRRRGTCLACAPKRQHIADRHRAAILANPHDRSPAFAASLGISVGTLRSYRSCLIKAGEIPSIRNRIDLDEVRELVEQGLDMPAVARKLKVSAGGIKYAARKTGTWLEDMRRDRVYTAKEVAAGILGYCPQYAATLIRSLKAAGLTVRQRRRRAPHRITADALMAFLARPDCPIPLERIADPDWRAFVEDERQRVVRRASSPVSQ